MQINEAFRNWPARYKNWSIEFFETVDHYIWVATPEVRKVLPAVQADKHLQSCYTADVRRLDRGSRYFMSENALVVELRRIGSQEALLFLNWLDKHILYPARRKRGELKTILPVYVKQAQEDYVSDMAKLNLAEADQSKFKTTMPRPLRFHRPVRERLNIFQLIWWPVTSHWQGQNNLKDSLFKAGFLMAVFIFLLWQVFNSVTNEDNYTGAYLLTQWEVVFLLLLQGLALSWWSFGMMRGALRRNREGSGFLVTLFLFVCASSFLFFSVDITVKNSGEWVSGWWELVNFKHSPTKVIHDPESKRIIVSGRIGFGSYRALESALKKEPRLSLVEIESPGGYVIEGLAMARLIAKHRLDTVSFQKCASACTLLLAAGVERYLGPEAKVGFHRSWTLDTIYNEKASPTDYKIAGFYRSQGTSEKLINGFLETPGYTMWYPRHDYMYISGYATHRWEDRKPGY